MGQAEGRQIHEKQMIKNKEQSYRCTMNVNEVEFKDQAKHPRGTTLQRLDADPEEEAMLQNGKALLL